MASVNHIGKFPDSQPEASHACSLLPPRRGGVESDLAHGWDSAPVGPGRDEWVRQAWVALLCRYDWECFATLTYRVSKGVGHESVLRHWRTWLFMWLRDTAIERGLAEVVTSASGRERVGGKWGRAYRRGSPAAHPVWVIGIERQQRGQFHIHGIIRYPAMLPDLRRTDGWSLWWDPPEDEARGRLFAGGGFAKIESPRDSAAVGRYVGKYVVKGGDVVLSPSFKAPRGLAYSDSLRHECQVCGT